MQTIHLGSVIERRLLVDFFHHAIGRLREWLSQAEHEETESQELMSEAEERIATADIQDTRNTSIFFLLPPV